MIIMTRLEIVRFFAISMHFILIGLDFSEKIVKLAFHLVFFFLFSFFSTHFQLTLYLLNLVSLALCSTTNVSDESRKTSVRSASASVGSSAHLNSLNSLQSSQDSSGKTQSVLQTNTGQTTFSRVPAAEYTSITQPHSPVYTQPTSPTGGYFISVNPQAALGPGKTKNC